MQMYLFVCETKKLGNIGALIVGLGVFHSVLIIQIPYYTILSVKT